MSRARLVLVLVAGLALGACAATPSPRDQVGVVVRIEKVRAHVLAARLNAASGRWDLAATHAGHPAEDLQPIDSALSRVDASLDATLRARIVALREATGVRSSSFADTAGAADETLAQAERIVAGSALDTSAFRAAVASELLELSTTEYSEGVADARLERESEYQDAYAFLTRARALVPDIDADLVAAMPSITAPATLVAADRIEQLVDAEKDRLAAISGASYARSRGADLAPLLSHLDEISAALGASDAHAANDALTAFRGTWTSVEAAVKARSAEAYARVENEMARAFASLAATPADLVAARDAVATMRTELVPFVAAPASYGVFDAAIILLREGLEALLIVAALLAFLARTGNEAKRRWIWAGSGAGIAASVAVALVITMVFSATESAGADRELLEGATGLFAAVMLLYMSWWLHSKSNLDEWQRYIRAKGGSALASGSLFGLALIAFLAVFREGAETALFYVGIAPSIAMSDLALGLGIALVALAAIGAAMIAFGMRIPVRPFFLVTSVLVYYLAFKFLGTGVHALQVAGAMPASPRTWLPDVGILGAFPTVETSAVQAALLVLALGWLIGSRRFDTVHADARRMGPGGTP